MPGLLSQLNCFSKKGRRSGAEDGGKRGDGGARGRPPLASGDSGSTGRIGSSDKGSPSSRLSKNLGADDNRNAYDDNSSIPTMDSDYNKVQSGNFSLSDAGGTIGTNNQSLTNFSQAASAFGTLNGVPVPPSAASAAGGDFLLGSPRAPVPQREEMLEIHAPGGKLGLVIDAPESSPTPVVHAIKDTCPIRDQIFVGDRLVAVDDVDVRGMTAVEVSRLISRRSGQERRRLTVIRMAARGAGAGEGEAIEYSGSI